MDLLDVVLLVLCAIFAVSGYRQGLLIGALSFVGLLGGGALGAKYAPSLHAHLHIGLAAPAFGLLVVVVAAILGQLVATAIGSALRHAISWSPVRTLDSVAGALVSVVSVLLVAWLLGTAVAHSATSGIARQVRGSAVLQGVDNAIPTSAQTWFGSFRRLLNTNGLPEVFGGIGPEHVTPVAPPDPATANSRAVRLAQPDIVKITGDATSCSRQLEGSGFVFAADRVMTNAHVVAGVATPSVRTSDGRSHAATVVLYDPRRDVAVLDVPGLGRSPLSFAGAVARGRSAIVAGYPEDGPFTAVAARVRAVQQAQGPDIYQDSQVTRQIVSLYAVVRPGNSGGPLLLSNGNVAGVVFAASVEDPHTGYALSAAEVASDATAGRGATTQVSTQGCD
jgi:S1-C subfamily serine protease